MHKKNQNNKGSNKKNWRASYMTNTNIFSNIT